MSHVRTNSCGGCGARGISGPCPTCAPSKTKKTSCASPCAGAFNQTVLQAALTALLAGNSAPIAALLADDVILAVNAQPPIIGKAAVVAAIDTTPFTAITIDSFQLGVDASGGSFAVVRATGTLPNAAPVAEMITFSFNAQCLITRLDEVIDLSPLIGG